MKEQCIINKSQELSVISEDKITMTTVHHTWCGRRLLITDSYFKTIESAVFNNIHKEGFEVCILCSSKIQKYLNCYIEDAI